MEEVEKVEEGTKAAETVVAKEEVIQVETVEVRVDARIEDTVKEDITPLTNAMLVEVHKESQEEDKPKEIVEGGIIKQLSDEDILHKIED